MSTPLPNVSDPCGYYGDLAVTVFCGPAELGEERRCVTLHSFTGRGGDVDMSLEQFRALADAIAAHAPGSPHERPRSIEATADRSTLWLATSNIVAMRVELIEKGQPPAAVWRATMWLAVAICSGITQCYKEFATEEEARTFAREAMV